MRDYYRPRRIRETERGNQTCHYCGETPSLCMCYGAKPGRIVILPNGAECEE